MGALAPLACALSLACFGSVALAQPKPDDAFAPHTSAIFLGESARQLVRLCGHPPLGPIEGVWTPSEADIAMLEPALFALLGRELRRTGSDRTPEGYYRQYGGLILGGRRVIYVNGFAAEVVHSMHRLMTPWVDWRTVSMTVCGDDPVAFRVEYDPAHRSFPSFEYNR